MDTYRSLLLVPKVRYLGPIDMCETPVRQSGFSTIELLIAMVIILSAISSVILVSFGNQSMLPEGELNTGALKRAQALVESEKAFARQDFRTITSMTAATDGVYTSAVDVDNFPSDVHTTKRITATVSWQDATHQERDVRLTELLTDFADASTTDTCDSTLSGDWSSPKAHLYTLSSSSLLPTSARIAASNIIGPIDAYHKRLYVGDVSRTAKSNDSLFIFDISNPTAPSYIGSTNNDPLSIDGLNALIVADTRVYVANAHDANFKTCRPGSNCSQLQIFDVTNPSTIPSPINFLLPTSSSPYVLGNITSSGQAIGKSIFYKDSYVYLGLSKTASGPEFNIIDVSSSTKPRWIGGYTVGASINQIYIKDSYAYLATDNKSKELIVLDVHNPSNPTFVGSFDPVGTSNFEVGESIYIVGTTAYLGMSNAIGSPELYTLNVSDPTTPTVLAKKVLGSSIFGLLARDSILLALTSTAQKMFMFDASNTKAITPFGVPTNVSGVGVAIDCEGNYIYGTSVSGSQGNLFIISPRE